MAQTLEHIEACLACGSRHTLPFKNYPAQMHPHHEQFTFSQCQSCGLIFLSTRIRADGLGAYYPPHYLPYQREKAWGRFASLVRSGLDKLDRDRVRVAAPHISLSKDSKVLDVGCGYPSFLKALQDKWGSECWGIDIAAANWQNHPPFQNLTLLNEDVQAIELKERFSLITMWHYLEHDYNPLATLRHLRQLSLPHTVLIVEVPNFDSWSRKAFGAHWAGYHTPRHTAIYTPQTLATLLENAGWRIEKAGLPGTLDGYLLWWLSWREKRGTRWSGSLEWFLPEFLLGQLLLKPFLWLTRTTPDVQLAIARPANAPALSAHTP